MIRKRQKRLEVIGMKWLKHNLSSLIYSNKSGFTLQKIMVLLALINMVLQIALGRIHNQAAYNVSSTVSIYTFIMQIGLILAMVSLMRINEKKRYYIYSALLLILSSAVIILYVVLMHNDIYYQTAISGGYSYEDAIKIVYAIDDSVNLQIFALVLNCIETGLFVAELIIRRRRAYGLSKEGRN